MQTHKQIALAAGLAGCLMLTGCFGFGKKKAARSGTNDSAEPDKVLYARAQEDIKHGRYDVGRLTLQTLINTYPDSEYLAKAKLAVADAYFKEGGTSNLTQAVAEYQDFITFFPFLDEAAYAQMQVGMTHYRRMEKPDRDRDETLEAEAAFQTYLQKYPSSELTPQVQQRLRDVQEILAEGDFRIASFYYIRKTDRAAAGRLIDLVGRYPLYSNADRANFMLASIYDRSEHSDVAAQYYSRIVRDYPLSPLVADSKARLVKIGVPVPSPDQTAMARMQQEQNTPRPRQGLIGSVLALPGGLLKTSPDVSMAARVGMPTMTPHEAENNDTLSPGAGGNLSVGSGGGGATSTGTGAYVESVTPGSASSIAPSTSSPASSTDASTQQGSTGAPAADSSSSTPSATTGDQPAPSTTPAQGTQESSSKKKKGLKKLIPWS